jgi:allantoicase
MEGLYSELGQLLDAIACRRNVHGPCAVAKRITDVGGSQVSGQEVSRCFFSGTYWTTPSFIAAFANAFELSIEERDRLAWLYTYGEELEDESQSPLKG